MVKGKAGEEEEEEEEEEVVTLHTYVGESAQEHCRHSGALTVHKEELIDEGKMAGFASADDLFQHFFKKLACVVCKQEFCLIIPGRICDIISEVFASSKLCPAGFFPLPHCFEIFGCDMMIDESGQVWLLEINSDPSFALYEGEKLEPKLKEIIEDVLDFVLDGGAASKHQDGVSGDEVYVAGFPFYKREKQNVTAQGGGGGEREGFPCVHARPPKYEGFAGLKVLRSLLRTSALVNKECKTSTITSFSKTGKSTCFVQKFTWFSEEVTRCVGESDKHERVKQFYRTLSNHQEICMREEVTTDSSD
eukprot:14506-Hanusia_phi.AAC.3